jgi:hypothetical protein
MGVTERIALREVAEKLSESNLLVPESWNVVFTPWLPIAKAIVDCGDVP